MKKNKRDFGKDFEVLFSGVNVLFKWLVMLFKWLFDLLIGLGKFVIDLSDKMFGEKRKKKNVVKK